MTYVYDLAVIAAAGQAAKVFMKAIVARESGALLGFYLFGPAASEAAQMATVAMRAGPTESALAEAMALHPSIAEELLALGDPNTAIHQKLPEPMGMAA